MSGILFPADLEAKRWLEFPAEGFAAPVSGVVFDSAEPPCCGVPLGGVATGCIDVDFRGVWGFSSIFNPESPSPLEGMKRQARIAPCIEPVLGLAVDGAAWVLATPDMVDGREIRWCTEPQLVGRSNRPDEWLIVRSARIRGVRPAEGIRGWGHYPVIDLQYRTDAPVSVAMRAWAPFIPGDTPVSNTPSAIFEVHLDNGSASATRGTVAFNFPGPGSGEARSEEFVRSPVSEDYTGVHVRSRAGVGYVLGVLGGPTARFGAGLCRTTDAWQKIGRELPQPGYRDEEGTRFYEDGSASAAVDFSLAAGESTVVRFLLAWHAPEWKGAEDAPQTVQIFLPQWQASRWESRQNWFTHMYASRYRSALDVARRMAEEHGEMLSRVLAWQGTVYGERDLPVWLRDSLVNNLALIPEVSYWAQPLPPLGDWAYPEGVYLMNESPRGCPHTSCNPCEWYGSLPITFFFPGLARTTLRAYRHYQKDDGEVPFALGRIGDLPDPANPEYYWQVSLNGVVYVDLIDRLWQATGDDTVLREFYESAKRCTTFTIGLNRRHGGIISLPEIGGMEWFEAGEWEGMASHMGGLRLAGVRIMERLARAVGDESYAARCRSWFEEGSGIMEGEMWAGTYYLNTKDPRTGNQSDDVMAYQLDGEWSARFHGLPGVYRSERVKAALATIRRCNLVLTPDTGAANFARPDGTSLAADTAVAAYGTHAVFTSELVVLAATYLYAGDRSTGLELARRHWETLVLRGRHPYDLPNRIDGATGRRTAGTDYYMGMTLWALPAAIAGQDLKAFCSRDGLAGRIIEAAKAPPRKQKPRTYVSRYSNQPAPA